MLPTHSLSPSERPREGPSCYPHRPDGPCSIMESHSLETEGEILHKSPMIHGKEQLRHGHKPPILLPVSTSNHSPETSLSPIDTLNSLSNFEAEMDHDGQGTYSLFPALDNVTILSGTSEALESEPAADVNDKPNMTWLDAAQIVLEEAGRPLHIKEIKQRILDRGLVQSNSKSSLEAVLYRETQKGSRRFKRLENRNGVFGLLTEKERQQLLQTYPAQPFLVPATHPPEYPNPQLMDHLSNFPSPSIFQESKPKLKKVLKKTLNEKYRIKYLRLRKTVKTLIFENAALCDEIAYIEQKFIRTKEERRTDQHSAYSPCIQCPWRIQPSAGSLKPSYNTCYQYFSWRGGSGEKVKERQKGQRKR
ncbi:transforming growth factor beta regulator 1 isoform X4 [Stegostoma tigrinum]|uniref:transforming growth factor beta regulator 1 isoform X4 n=1 Tax=Stegostoma tigrinum TaxID=3053191 RepID=UPI0028701FD8|nr:transforming growth factor beta regulator 1 isoform X4 [Stegostoma tigrinum]XP_059496393.1 transforming growth factor beta regulator 1 isoform X4 [Stegostoma tigrinum]